uniref:Uncharacterized protein n=1 Tax=Hucho hucho TaxID=62062 RepID=A0A4W5R8E4_9TELE
LESPHVAERFISVLSCLLQKDELDDSTIELSKVQSVKVVAKKRRERGLPRAFEIFTDSKTYPLSYVRWHLQAESTHSATTLWCHGDDVIILLLRRFLNV